MPFQAMWCVPGRVVYIQQWGIVEVEDSVGTDQAIAEYAQSSPHLVHGIIDKLGVDGFNFGVKEIQTAFAHRPKPTPGWVVAVHHTRFSAFLSQIMAQSQEMKTRTFHDLLEAVDFLCELDDALPAAESWEFPTESNNLHVEYAG